MKDPEIPSKVFISYARENQTQAMKFYHRLKKAGHLPWIDVEDLLPGQIWARTLEEAIDEADVFLVLLSHQAIDKGKFYAKEIALALERDAMRIEKKIFIIPVRLNSCDVPSELQKYHWVDYVSGADWKKLCKILDNLCDQKRISERAQNSELDCIECFPENLHRQDSVEAFSRDGKFCLKIYKTDGEIGTQIKLIDINEEFEDQKLIISWKLSPKSRKFQEMRVRITRGYFLDTVQNPLPIPPIMIIQAKEGQQ